MKNIVLIGYMGSGKTTIGKQLAKELGYEFCDTDAIIEKNEGCKISDIFHQNGEEYFRKIETKTILDMSGSLEHAIISTGGGMPCLEENAKLLKQLGTVIYLKVTKETVLHRLQKDQSRPLLQDGDKVPKVEKMLRIRGPLYERAANHIIETDNLSVKEVVERILDLYHNKEREQIR